MKSFKEIAEARYTVTTDYRISASGRKVHRMKKIADDPRDLDHDGDVDKDDKKLAKESHAPVAPVPDRKYIKGTPEWKANKEKNKPRTGHPTNESAELDEAVDQHEARLLQLARLGLVDKADVSKLRIAIDQLKADKPLSAQQRTLLLGVMSDLIGLVTGDDMIFNRMKRDVQKEDYEIIEEEEIIIETKDNDKDDQPPFDPDPPKKPSATPGKFGSGYSTARHLARLALQKQQKKQGK